jgi:molybdenum cofactor biosynthesis protein B
MGQHEGEATPTVVTFTISDTRTEATDVGGAVLRECLTQAGARVLRHGILPDDPERVRDAVRAVFTAREADAVVTTGGTGITPRDGTFEALEGLLEKTLDGFGEAFRRLSWDAIGPRAILSRAVAGTCQGGVVAALPGSPDAVRLGVEKVLGPTLGHMVALTRRR